MLFWGLLLVFRAVFAGTLEFRLQPDGPGVTSVPVKGVFFIFLGQRAEPEVHLYLWNAAKGAGVSPGVPKRMSEGLLWGPIMLLRECDPAPKGKPVLLADPGDLLVAAADTGGGISTTARATRPGPRNRVLKVLNSEGNEVDKLYCGSYTLSLKALDSGASCKPEEVTLGVISGGRSTSLVLRETGVATGIFTATFEMQCLFPDHDPSASVAGLVLPPNAEGVWTNPPQDTGKQGAVPALAIKPTAKAALPGRDFLIILEFFLPEGVKEASLQVEAPAGWDVREGGICGEIFPCPIPAPPVFPARMAVILAVPPTAGGFYPVTISIPELGKSWYWELEVRACLDPLDVVRHWDVERGDLDLASPGEVTYERLLWAITQVGERLPHACRFLTYEDLGNLATEWAQGR